METTAGGQLSAGGELSWVDSVVRPQITGALLWNAVAGAYAANAFAVRPIHLPRLELAVVVRGNSVAAERDRAIDLFDPREPLEKGLFGAAQVDADKPLAARPERRPVDQQDVRLPLEDTGQFF